METTIVYWGSIGIIENKMEATILGLRLTSSERSVYDPAKKGRFSQRGPVGCLGMYEPGPKLLQRGFPQGGIMGDGRGILGV